MTPIPTVWWLRPVSRAARVGAHSAVVWNRLYFRPFAASRSAVGVAHGPPKALDAAKPTSSSKMTSTFGRAGRRPQRLDRRERRVRVLGVVREGPFEWLVRDRQDVA